jgi:putative flippase GtrA
VLGYGAFLVLLTLGVGAKTSSASLFVLSMLINFWANRAYVFRSQSAIGTSFARYILTALLALSINIGAIYLFVDHLRLKAEYVQIFSIVFISFCLFLGNKFVVHKASA